MNQNISKEEFLIQYDILNKHHEKLMRDQANSYILKFHNSDQSWSIAQQLIYETQQADIQFIACQIIYRKTKESFHNLPNQQREQLKIFIQKLLIGQELQLHPLSLKQICSTWAQICLQDDSMWTSCLQELISLMQNGTRGMEIGLEVMSQIAIETKELRGQMKQTAQEAFLKQQEMLEQIFISLLLLQDINLLQKALLCIDAWINFGLQIFLNNTLSIQLFDLTFQALEADNFSMFSQFIQTILSAVTFSKKKSLHGNDSTLTKMYQMLEPQEKQSLIKLSILQIESAKLLIQKTQVKRQDQVWKDFAELVCRFSCDFTIIVLFEPSGFDLIQLIIFIVQYPSRIVAYTSFEFWVELRQTLLKKGKELQELGIRTELFYNFFLQTLQPIMDKCQLKTLQMTKKFLGGCSGVSKIIDVENGNQESIIDSDGSDQDQVISLRNLSALDFREHAKDLFYAVYQAQKDYQGDLGQQQFFIVILSNLTIVEQIQQSQGLTTQNMFMNLVTRTEVAIFVVQTILDDFLLELNHEHIQNIIELILTLKKQVQFIIPSNNLPEGWMNIIVKTSLQLFYEFTQQSKFTPELFQNILIYTLDYIIHPKLGPLAAQGIEAISQITNLPITVQIMQSLVMYFKQNYLLFVNESQVENFITAIFNLAFNLVDSQTIFIIFQEMFTFITEVFLNLSANLHQCENHSPYEQSVNTVLSALNWFILNNEKVEGTPLASLPSQITSIIVHPITQTCNDTKKGNQDFLNKIVKLFKVVLRVCDYNTQTRAVEDILSLALNQVVNDPIKNCNWLQLISLATQRSNKSLPTKMWLQNNLAPINLFCLQQYEKWLDPDLVRYWVEVQRQILVSDVQLILSAQYETILQALAKALLEINQYEMQREIILFFKDLVINVPKDQIQYQNSLPFIIYTLFSSLHQINPAMITSIHHIVVYLAHQIPQIQLLVEQIEQGIKVAVDFQPKQIHIISQAIVAYALQTDRGSTNRDLKLLLTNIRPQADTELNYLQLEMVVVKFQKITNIHL